MKIIPYRKVTDLDVKIRELLPTPGVRFIVPSRRDRSWWRQRADLCDFGLEDSAEDKLWNWEGLYKTLCQVIRQRPLRQIEPPDHRLIMSAIITEFLQEHSEMAAIWPGMARPGFIDILSDDVRELINEDVRPEQLHVMEDEAKPTSKVLPLLYRRYLSYLTDNGLMDSAEIPLKTRALLSLSPAATEWTRDINFVFAGFMSFTHGQSSLLMQLNDSAAEVTVLKPATALAGFNDATVQLEDKTWEEEPPFTSGEVISMANAACESEYELLARELALWSAGQGQLNELHSFPGFGSIGMMTPRGTAVKAENALRRYRIPCFPARSRSVDKTLPGMALTPMWNAWTGQLEVNDTALLLANPCLAGSSFPIDDAALWATGGADGWQSYLEYRVGHASDSAEQSAFAHALKALKAIVSFCRVIDKGAAPADLLGAWLQFLQTRGLWLDALVTSIKFCDSLDESMRETSSAISEIEDKHIKLKELQPDLGPCGKTKLAGGDAIDFLKSWSKETLVQPMPPTSGSLVIYDGPPPILASFPVWIMTEITQKEWPGTLRDSPLLSSDDRELLSQNEAYLPSMHDKRIQKEALFRRLLQMGDEITITSHSLRDSDRRPMGVTAFLASFIDDMNKNADDDSSWKLLTLPVTQSGALLPEAGAPYFPYVEVPESSYKSRTMPKIRTDITIQTAAEADERKISLAVSSLKEILDCPFRYWFQRHAALGERSTELWNSAMAGSFTHMLWESVWRRLQDDESQSIAALASAEWEAASQQNGKYGAFRVLFSDRRLVRYQQTLKFFVERLAQMQQDTRDKLKTAGFTLVKVLTEDEAALEYELEGVAFTGRCDRIEILKSPQFSKPCAVIADYKLGKAASYEKGLKDLVKRGYNTQMESFKHGLQLSAYALMVSEKLAEYSLGGVCFLGHGDGTIAGTFLPELAVCYHGKASGKTSLKQRIDEAREAMSCAAQVLKSGTFQPYYRADACRYCDLKGVCRQGEVRGENLTPTDDSDEQDDDLAVNED